MPADYITRKEFNEFSKKMDKHFEEMENRIVERLNADFEQHIGALLEEFIHRIAVIGEGFMMRERRITALESKVD